jgi:hypothetical protein
MWHVLAGYSLLFMCDEMGELLLVRESESISDSEFDSDGA